MDCHGCGAKVDVNSHFCGECGAPVEDSETMEWREIARVLGAIILLVAQIPPLLIAIWATFSLLVRGGPIIDFTIWGFLAVSMLLWMLLIDRVYTRLRHSA